MVEDEQQIEVVRFTKDWSDGSACLIDEDEKKGIL